MESAVYADSLQGGVAKRWIESSVHLRTWDSQRLSYLVTIQYHWKLKLLRETPLHVCINAFWKHNTTQTLTRKWRICPDFWGLGQVNSWIRLLGAGWKWSNYVPKLDPRNRLSEVVRNIVTTLWHSLLSSIQPVGSKNKLIFLAMAMVCQWPWQHTAASWCHTGFILFGYRYNLNNMNENECTHPGHELLGPTILWVVIVQLDCQLSIWWDVFAVRGMPSLCEIQNHSSTRRESLWTHDQDICVSTRQTGDVKIVCWLKRHWAWFYTRRDTHIWQFEIISQFARKPYDIEILQTWINSCNNLFANSLSIDW